MSSSLSQEFLNYLDKDFVCLHPSDTIPGLAFNPLKSQGHQSILDIKQRNPNKPYIGFVESIEKAMTFWKPLPGNWENVLKQLWPCSLSVIWKANESTPKSLVFEDGTVAIRCPKFKEEFSWMNDVLKQISYPLPSTSVNRTAEYPCIEWDEAVSFLQNFAEEVYIPKLHTHLDNFQSSTLIKILEDGSFSMIREGPISKDMILKHL